MSPPPAKSNPLPRILLVCGGLGLFGILGIGGLLFWIFSTPKSPESQTGMTLRADQDGVFGQDALVFVPKGAVDHDVPLTLRSRPAPAGGRVVGRVWAIQVDGRDHYAFRKPVRLALPFDRALATDPAAVSLARWEEGRWLPVPGSRIDGDRVSAEVDHFSEYAPVQDGKPKSLLDAGAWYGRIDIAIQGSWGHKSSVSSSHWSIARDASVEFRLSQKIPMLNTKASWITSPDDQARVRVSVNDGGFRTDDDHDHSGHVYYHTTGTANATVQIFAPTTLEIDQSAGTYTLTGGSIPLGLLAARHWSEGGKKAAPENNYTKPLSVSTSLPARKLPSTQGVISETFPIPFRELNGRIAQSPVGPDKSVRGTLTITLSPVPITLAARITGPLSVRRGDEVALDGSGSTGDIVEYRWRFTVDPGCPGSRMTEPTGKNVSFHALWTFKARLEVKDRSGRTASTERTIEVRARDGLDWETAFATKVADPVRSRMLAEGMQIGINQCDRHDQDQVTGHKFHTTARNNATWVDDGYAIGKIADDGPFAGLHFISKQQLAVDRAERVNVNLIPPTGEIAQLNLRQKNYPPVQALLEQVKQHEAAHSRLMKEELDRLKQGGQDPAAGIEALIDRSPNEVQRKADGLIRAGESALFDATSEPKVKERLRQNRAFLNPVQVWFPSKRDGVEREVQKDLGPLWQLGDE